MIGRFTPTHTLTAQRDVSLECDGDADCPAGTSCEDGQCVGPYGDPVRETQTVLEASLVRYRPGGTEYVRAETGERVGRQDTVKGLPALQAVAEGDDLVLEPLDDSRASIEALEVQGTQPQQGRGGRVESVVLELASV